MFLTCQKHFIININMCCYYSYKTLRKYSAYNAESVYIHTQKKSGSFHVPYLILDCSYKYMYI